MSQPNVIPRPIALVTGGSRGLGRSMVRAIAGQGTDVIFTYQRGKAEADAVVAEVDGLGRRAAALPLDVGNAATFAAFTDQVREVLRGWGADRVQFLVNNAGIGIHAPFVDTTEAQFDQLFAIHVKGPFFLTQTLLPLLADGGRIVNVGTGLTRFVEPGYSAYAGAKAAVEVLTRYLAQELGARGIRVNAVAPGATETDFSGGVVRDNPQVNERIASLTALGRAGLPDDIGGVVASLLGDGMGWVNGQRIESSGGQRL